MKARQDKGHIRITGRALLWVALAAAASLISASAQAAFTVTISQVGANVVADGSGTFNLTALVPHTSGITTGGAGIAPQSADVAIGPIAQTLEDPYSGIAGPTSFGSGGLANADAGSGAIVEVAGNATYLYVPAGYVSGNPLTGSATWNNQTLAGLGLTPGTYVWTWGSGATADSFTVIIGAAPTSTSVPTLSQWGLLALSALLSLVAVRRWRA